MNRAQRRAVVERGIRGCLSLGLLRPMLPEYNPREFTARIIISNRRRRLTGAQAAGLVAGMLAVLLLRAIAWAVSR